MFVETPDSHNNDNYNNNNDIERHNSRRSVYNHLSAPRTASHSSGQVANVCKSRATHRALMACSMSCTRLYEGTAQLSY